jgi:peptide/nickel transport system permease protein
MNKEAPVFETYWKSLWKQFKKHRYGYFSLYVVLLFCLMGVYAPFLASSKPFWVYYEGQWYFPLFRYLFYSGFYTKNIDIFFNLLIFIVPACLVAWVLLKKRQRLCLLVLNMLLLIQMTGFLYAILSPRKDPASNPHLTQERQQALKTHPYSDWNFDLAYMTPYGKLNLIIKEQQRLKQHERIKSIQHVYTEYLKGRNLQSSLPTLWQTEYDNEIEDNERQRQVIESEPPNASSFKYAQAKLKYNQERRHWIQDNIAKLKFEMMPLLSDFHWEDDAGGEQSLNQFLPWWDLTRVNRKDLLSALIFGVRISLVVGLMAVGIALLIGVPVGAYAGFYGGIFDIIVSRLLEVWESMPTFFMLLFVVAVTQSKSIFLVIMVIGLFGWTSFSRYIRGEFFKQRHLPYVEACRALGFNDSYIMFSHILPNAIPPVLTLLPFAIMGAITSEAGLSFLGLGEEGSCSWGVLMDEGRQAFPGESYLLWPPAILLTLLLVAIALVGDALRDTLDPKLRS